VHDHTSLMLTLDENDQLVGHQPPENPHRLDGAELQKVIHAYSTLVAAIFKSVCDSIVTDSSELKSEVELIYARLERSAKFRANRDEKGSSATDA
jgi:hypothetical protein